MIKTIAKQAAAVLETKLLNSEDKLNAAMIEREEANDESETPKPFTIGFSIKIDLAKSKASYKLGFSTRYTDETSEPLPDKAQLGLFEKAEDDGGGE